MWIEWENALLNTNSISRIFVEEIVKYLDSNVITKLWKIRIILTNGEGEYAKTFSTREEAQKKHKEISDQLLFVCPFIHHRR